MSQMDNWSIPFSLWRTTVRSQRRQRPVFSPSPQEPSFQGARVRGIKTTGLFPVPNGEGDLVLLVVFLSSVAEETEKAEITINCVTRGTLAPFLSRSITIKGGEAQKIEIDGLEEQIVEVTVSLSSEEIKPSLAVTRTVLPEGATIPMLWKSPARFVPV